MDKLEALKSMLNHVINDNTDSASLDLHNYLAVKMREVAGLSTPVVAQPEEVDNPEELEQPE